MLIVIDRFLDMIKSISASLQGNNLTLGQKIIQLSSLATDLESAIGEFQNSNVKIKEKNILLEDAGTVNMGHFFVKCCKALAQVQLTSLLTLSLTRRLNKEAVDAEVSS